MSWFSSNYDKALLGAGALIALVLIYFGWSQLQLSGQDFETDLVGSGEDNAAVEGAERIEYAKQSMELDHGWKQADYEGRPVDLFTGIPLFIKRDTGGKAVDLLKGAEVHPPIDNDFWLEFDVDPGFADSPQRDPDGDGFSNLEEFNAGTHPKDPANHPPLIGKLRYINDESVSWLLKPGFLGQDGAVAMTYVDGNGGKNKAGAAEPVAPGKLFFANGAAQGRFKYLGHEKREEMNPAINMMEKVDYVRIEDQKANKVGDIYEIPAPLKGGQREEFIQHDRSAVMELKAVGAGGKQMVIEENTHFSLPDGEKKKPYFLKAVTPESIIVEYPGEDGKRLTVEILKGAMPRL